MAKLMSLLQHLSFEHFATAEPAATGLAAVRHRYCVPTQFLEQVGTLVHLHPALEWLYSQIHDAMLNVSSGRIMVQAAILVYRMAIIFQITGVNVAMELRDIDLNLLVVLNQLLAERRVNGVAQSLGIT